MRRWCRQLPSQIPALCLHRQGERLAEFEPVPEEWRAAERLRTCHPPRETPYRSANGCLVSSGKRPRRGKRERAVPGKHACIPGSREGNLQFRLSYVVDAIAKPLGGLMAKIIKLVSEWGNLAHRVSATPDQIGGQRFIRLTFYSDDSKAIAAVNISADALPDHDRRHFGRCRT